MHYDKDQVVALGFVSDGTKDDNALNRVLRKHKWKWLTGLMIAIAAALIIIFFLPSKVSTSNGSISTKASLSLADQLAASKGTSIPMVSIIPSKSSDSSTVRRLESLRRLVGDLVVFPRRLSSLAVAPALFPETSDYNLFGEPTFLVGDRSTEAVSTINLISCMSSQLRIKDIGLNVSYNPNLLPYAAIIDVSKCGPDQKEIMTWYVESTGPENMGDGSYKSNMIFRGFESEMHITLKNKITDGILQSSTFAFKAVDGDNFGILIIDNTLPDVSDITFYQQMQSMSQWMHVNFNPTTFVGKAITKTPEGTRYSLDFDFDAIARQTNSSGSISTACIDYSYDKKILVGNSYTLFNADDGSKVQLQTGFNVDTVINLSGINTTVNLWCSFWGLWASGSKINGSYVDSNTILSQISTGQTVSRMDYVDKERKTYTIKKRTARLNKIVRNSFTLGNVKGMVLKITSQGKFNGVNIKWNGTHFVNVGNSEIKCLKITDYNQKATPVQTTFIPTEWYECGCLDTNGKTEPFTKRIYGQFDGQTNSNNPPFFQTGEIRTVLNASSETIFTFTANDFSNGIQISTTEGNMQGIINVEYIPTQIIHGMKLDLYNIGDTVAQSIGGLTATGVVYKATESFLFGFSCTLVSFEGYVDSSNILHVINVLTPDSSIGNGMQFNYNGCPNDCNNQYWGNIGQQQSANTFQVNGNGEYGTLLDPVQFSTSYCFSYTSFDWNSITTDHFCNGTLSYSSGIDKGAILTQGTSSARTTTSYWVGQQEGIGIEMISGSYFNTSADITISSDGYGDWSNRGYHNVEGTLTFYNNLGLDTDWSSAGPPVTFKLKDNGLTTGCSTVTLTNLPLTNGNITVYGWTGGLWWTQVTAAGTNCDIVSDYTYDISIDLPNCDYEITYKCKARVVNKSSQITVKLPSSTATRFQRERPIFVNSQLKSNYVYWIEDSSGEALPLDDNTILSYQTQTLVADDDAVPLLLCYDNCPYPTSNIATTTINRRLPLPVLSSYVQINSVGKCSHSFAPLSVLGYDVSFVGFMEDPLLNISWSKSSSSIYDANTGNTTLIDSFSLASVVVLDPGRGCDKDLVDVLFNTSISCETAPQITLSCNSNGDYKDFRNAYPYHFDPSSGLLVDTLTSFPIEITADGTDTNFGVFFEGTALNKQLLLCPQDQNQVCAWQSWSVLDSFYTYDTGPHSQKVTLFDDQNNAVHFQQPLNLVVSLDNPVSASGLHYDGTTFLLTYQGEGNLNGLPQVCLNTDMKPGQCDYESSSYSDITLSTTQILVDLNSGNKYYTKASIMNEYYPLADDPSICLALTFSSMPSEPNASDFENPDNMESTYPSETDLNTYLNNGQPVVISGTTIYELNA